MAGELWRSYFQIGREDPIGTPVAATRRMYFRPDSRLSRERDARPHRFATASRDNVRAHTLGPVKVGGKVSLAMSATELIEVLLITMAGGVTPTGSGPNKLWTFTPAETLEAATVEWQDGARSWQASGVHGNKLTISGAVNGENTCTVELFGRAMGLEDMTAALPERLPQFSEGWQTKLFVDAFGATPGTTQVTGTLINWEVEIDNALARKYFAECTLDAGAIPVGELGITAKLTYEAASAAAAAEFANWDGMVKRLIRLYFCATEEIAVNEIQTLSISGAPTGGTFTLTYSGQTTAAINHDANAGAVQAALEALSNISSGDVVCAGGPLPGDPITITFQGSLANTDVALITSTDSLTGGTDPASAIAETRKGGGQPYFVAVDVPGAWQAVDLGGEDEGTRTYELQLHYVYDPTNAFGVRVLAQNDRSAAW